MQSGCSVSRLHSIISANLLRRRICLFGSYECPIFQGSALGAFEKKRIDKFFLKNKARFLISFSKKTETWSELTRLRVCCPCFYPRCNAELHPCDVFSGVTHVEDLFFAVSTFLFFEQGTFFKAGIEPATRGFSVPCYTNLATKFFAVRAF